MKASLLFCLLLSTVLFTKCDDNTTTELNGSWNLVHITGGLAGFNYEFEPDVIKWTFNENNNKLNVVNNYVGTHLYSGYETGSYDYTIEMNQGNENLYINNDYFGKIIIDEDGLVIDQNIATDGFLFNFIK